MHADLFCRIVDNYGDIGVCWRLARQLASTQGWHIRLWVDDLTVFSRLEPTLDTNAGLQRLRGIDIVHWTQTVPDLLPGEIVIETFACTPPPAFVHRMQDLVRPPVWINLDYLSAEPWVEQCHGLPSPQAGGLAKYFFFPGFTQRTGGLLREPTLLPARDALQADPAARAAFHQSIGLPLLQESERLISLFCYPDAPVTTLCQALAESPTPSLVAVPLGIAPQLQEGRWGAVRIVRIPFLSQDDYDHLLWCAHLNFVRGEDSFVRAQWAGRPMVWHIYPQADAAHVDKLDAWLRAYPADPIIHDLNRAWNGEHAPSRFAHLLTQALASPSWQEWQNSARSWSDTLADQSDLAENLAAFCHALEENRS